MEYKTLSNIIDGVDVHGAAHNAFTLIFAQIQTYTPLATADIVIAYRGIEVGDVPQLGRLATDFEKAALIDGKNGYISYILRGAMIDHIARVVRTMGPSWIKVADIFGFPLDPEFMTIVGRRYPGDAMSTLCHFLADVSHREELSHRNACMIIEATDLLGYDLFEDMLDMDGDFYAAERNMRSLIAAMNAAGMAVPEAIQDCADRYAAHIADVAALEWPVEFEE